MPVAIRSIVIALGLGAFLAVSVLAPVPMLSPVVSAAPGPDSAVTSAQAASVELTSDAAIATVVASQSLPSAAGWISSASLTGAVSGTDSIWTNDDSAHPIASLTKLVTALVGLEQEPLEPGEAGAVHVWDEYDIERQDELLALNGVAFPIPIGTEVTHQQMLTLMLVPSANDFAMSYAYSIFGDNEAFVQAVDAWKERHGLSSLQVVEPSGMSPGNLANAADLVRISQLALAQPVVAEIIGSASADLPWGIGEVMNSNPLFGVMPGIVGVKTGFTEEAGYNLAAATQSESDGYTFTAIAVVLGRDSVESSAEDAEVLLTALAATPRTAKVVEVPIHIENLPQTPDFWWRITHPLTLFGIDGVSPVT